MEVPSNANSSHWGISEANPGAAGVRLIGKVKTVIVLMGTFLKKKTLNIAAYILQKELY